MALVTVDLSVSITFSRSMLLDSGAPSRSLFGWCGVADVNPSPFIKGHVNPEVLSSSDGAELISILHRW